MKKSNSTGCIKSELKDSEQYELKCFEYEEGIKLVKLTHDNVAKVEAFIRTDSNYRISDNADYSPYWILEMGKHLGQIKGDPTHSFEEIVQNLVEKLDKENGTHLTADHDGKEIDRKTARTFMVEKIVAHKEKLLDYLKNPDFEKEDNLIDILSKKTGLENNKGRSHLSFASKFCHYSCYFLFDDKPEQDNFSIYDRVVYEALDYYLKHYKIVVENYKLGSDEKGSIRYSLYQEAIDKILDAAEERISRNGFDHLIWYYFKGNQVGKIKKQQKKQRDER